MGKKREEVRVWVLVVLEDVLFVVNDGLIDGTHVELRFLLARLMKALLPGQVLANKA